MVNFVEFEPVVKVKLQITIVAHLFLFIYEIWDEFFGGLPLMERVGEGL